jgi:hypothetical protein
VVQLAVFSHGWNTDETPIDQEMLMKIEKVGHFVGLSIHSLRFSPIVVSSA